MSSQLYCGNCLNILRDIEIDKDKTIIVTDPPFNIGYHYHSYSDDMNSDEYLNMLYEILYNRKSVVIHYPETLYRIAAKIQTFPTKVMSWVYNSNTPKQHRDIAFFNVKPDFSLLLQPYKNLNDKRIQERLKNGKLGSKTYDWFQVNQVKNVSQEKTEHPCQMPIESMLRIVGVLPKDFIIIDPFMGSGTTGIACKMLDRDFIGIDIDEKYVDIASERLNNTSKEDLTKYNLILPQ